MIKRYWLIGSFLVLTAGLSSLSAAERPIKAFILAGQSNMVGWGDSTQLPPELKRLDGRLLMFEDDQWQMLRPFREPNPRLTQKFGLTEYTFGPEIAFAHEIARAWPDERVGIIKVAFSGTGICAWIPDWSKELADRTDDGRLGSLYEKLVGKMKRACAASSVEVVGFVWQQGAADMKSAELAKEYLGHLKSLVASVRRDAGNPELPVIFGSYRRGPLPDDITGMPPDSPEFPRIGAYWVMKAQQDAEQEISNSRMVLLRDLETYPRNAHFNPRGLVEMGQLLAGAYLELTLGSPESR